MSIWEVHALKYAERNARTRADSFMFADNPTEPHAMDYFMWVLRRGEEVILVDTGYDAAEGAARDRPIRLDPGVALEPLGLTPDAITDVIVTHLHYDHAGGLHLFPNAHLHMQSAEMAFATGPCMCHPMMRFAFTAEHVCEAIRRLYSGKLTFYDGDAEIADGVTVHHVGGHSRGLQFARVRTASGFLVLASDTAHYYENFLRRRPFPLVVDVTGALDGFASLEQQASRRTLIVPGHDPLVTSVFPQGSAPHIWRLDQGPNRPIPGMT